MGSVDHAEVERRAMRAFELAMLRRAAVAVVPVLAAGGAALLLTGDVPRTALLAAFVAMVCGFCFWRRRGAEAAAALGFFAGLVPYGASIVASRWGGHVCTPGGCTSMCVPACTLGGVIAAVLVARGAARRRAGLAFWLPASAMTVATGALGCSCAGFAGASGMLAGFALTSIPLAIVARSRRESR